MSNPFNNADEFEKSFESGVQQTVTGVKKVTQQVVSDAKKQVTPTTEDMNNFLYGVSEQPAGQESAGQGTNASSDSGIEQVASGQQSAQHKIDPAMQASQEGTQLDETRKQLYEMQRLHNQNYIRGVLDTSPTLEQQVAKVRQEREQEEKRKLQEEEEAKQKQQEEEQQNAQSLQEPSTKAKPGDPNIATKRAKTTTEINRGTSG